MSNIRLLPTKQNLLADALSNIKAFEDGSDRLLASLQAFEAFRESAERLNAAAHEMTMLSMDAKLVSDGVRVHLPFQSSYLRLALSGKPVILSQIDKVTAARYYRGLVKFAMADLHGGNPPITVQQLKTARDTDNLPQLHSWHAQLVTAGFQESISLETSASLAQRKLDMLRVSPMMEIMRGWASSAASPVELRVAAAAAVLERVSARIEAECSAPIAAHLSAETVP